MPGLVAYYLDLRSLLVLKGCLADFCLSPPSAQGRLRPLTGSNRPKAVTPCGLCRINAFCFLMRHATSSCFGLSVQFWCCWRRRVGLGAARRMISQYRYARRRAEK